MKLQKKVQAHDPSDPGKGGSRAHSSGEWPVEVIDPLLLDYPYARRLMGHDLF